MTAATPKQVYQGQFGEFTISEEDRRGVIIYRSGLLLCALSFTLGSALVLSQGATDWVLSLLTPLFALFSLGLGISLVAIHIYLIPLHRLLQVFWAVGTLSALIIGWQVSEPLALFIYKHPITLLGVGFIFAALTGIYFKEAFCFARLETKFLTPLVPTLLLGHLTGLLPVSAEQLLLTIWSFLFIIFVLRKAVQPIPPDIGDKSIFTHLKENRS
jgi:uncharacterized integral membrane protein